MLHTQLFHDHCFPSGFAHFLPAFPSDGFLPGPPPEEVSSSAVYIVFNMSLSLQDKTAIVTGGSRGIGAGIAGELAKCGAKVLITYASASEAAENVVENIRASGGQATSLQADCMDEKSPQKVVRATIDAFAGGIDIIINNAGAGDEMFLKDETYEHFDKMFYTNVRFPMFLVKECLPYLRRGARIVNIGSVVARQGEWV